MSTGLRERKKEATRRSLHDAAVRLALEHGVENVTVEAIADAAFVSRRTFSNYFASKEQALFHRDRTQVASLVAHVRARPDDEPPVRALLHAAERMRAESAERDRDAGRDGETGHGGGTERGGTRRVVDGKQYQELRQHPALLRELAATYTAIERDLASALEPRLPAGPDAALHARMLSASFLALLRVCGQEASENPDRDPLDLLRQAMELTSQGTS
ncbi:TetR/AcrR family transcriptional regulator [Streptomyces sp. NPDC054796]